jgi:hypothetical protein
MPPTDPLIYRPYELVMLNGPAWKALIEEEFGDGIMSAIDFDIIERLPDPKAIASRSAYLASSCRSNTTAPPATSRRMGIRRRGGGGCQARFPSALRGTAVNNPHRSSGVRCMRGRIDCRCRFQHRRNFREKRFRIYLQRLLQNAQCLIEGPDCFVVLMKRNLALHENVNAFAICLDS